MTEKLLRHDRRYKSGGGPFTEKKNRADRSFDGWALGLGAPCMAAAGLAVTLAGCSFSMPIATLASSTSSEDATGSIQKSSLEHQLDPEDWRRAKAALATALDPQGNGSVVGWDNPESGNKGSFTPVGKAYPANERICRIFVSQIERKGNEQSMRGTACTEKGGDWTIAEVAPSKKI
ncbi:RT0821/Lpp0805 family surface protein [Methylocapsa polymorpha]|uniref:RT0821/Lpp0805 family surface protein n=1 Tax=Methylocapsa polymorpha TaxID=3080828 RepID=A0ABZ0HTK5_9HYPH|nr:RT0821/Lpp0805 family surface protein [Methylocapsa sp. RX1]